MINIKIIIANWISSIQIKYSLLILFALSTNFLYSQNQSEISNSNVEITKSNDRIYGLDPLLYNGKVYTSFYPISVKGNQYFIGSDYVKGEATIRGVRYQNLDLNYDILKQELLLKYLNSNNVINIITISKAWLEGFSIGNARFILMNSSNSPERIYQELGNDSLHILYFFKKDLELENVSTKSNFKFVGTKEMYVLMDKTLMRFKNNRSFMKLFPKEKQINVKKYLRQNRIKVNKASDQAMEELINNCSKSLAK